MYSRHHKLVFIHVPKCAGMSVEYAMGGLPRSQRTEQHFSGHAYKRYHPDIWQRYHRFTVVRHPVDRALSFVRFYRRFDPVWRRHLRHVDDDALLQTLLMSHNMLTEQHASAMLTGEEEVLHLETLDTAWPRFADDHGLPDVLPRVNAGPSTPREPPSSRATAMIATLFPEDFTRFGYPLPSSPTSALPLEDQGAVAWAALRAWALRVADGRSAGDPAAMKRAIDAWVADLPEASWRDLAADVLVKNPLEGRRGPEVVWWTEAVHEAVNHALGKAPWDPWVP